MPSSIKYCSLQPQRRWAISATTTNKEGQAQEAPSEGIRTSKGEGEGKEREHNYTDTVIETFAPRSPHRRHHRGLAGFALTVPLPPKLKAETSAEAEEGQGQPPSSSRFQEAREPQAEQESESGRNRDRDGKKKKQHKKDKKHGSAPGPVTTWGKYGTIIESDMFNKEQEFHAWLLEEKVLDLETLSKSQLKKHIWRITTPLLYRTKTDLGIHKASTTRKVKTDDSETYLNREQLMELRRVRNERAQVGKMKLLGLDVKQNFSIRMDGNAFE